MSHPDTAFGIQESVDEYLRSREQEVTDSTLQAHRYRLSHVERWAAQRSDVDSTADLTIKHINHDYRLWRRDDGDLNRTSVHTQLATVRVWIKWLGSVGAVAPDMHEYIELPTLSQDDEVNTTVLEEGIAEEILYYLDRFQYASSDHVVWMLLYGTGIRIGAIHSLDVGDVDTQKGRLRLRHRPDEGTTLKNGNGGERTLAIDDDITRLLNDYIKTTRIEQTDEYGRDPLITTQHGRMNRSSLRRRVYRWTQPCQRGDDCPHGTTEAACSTAGYTCNPSGCPSIRPPHSIRKRVIINYRNEGVPDKAIQDRCNVSEEIIDAHYDMATEEEQTKRRADYFT